MWTINISIIKIISFLIIYINLLINIHNLIYFNILLIHKTASLILYSLLISITLLFNQLYFIFLLFINSLSNLFFIITIYITLYLTWLYFYLIINIYNIIYLIILLVNFINKTLY